jgi:L-aminopeptidase/D-esterase-like protein
VVAESRDGYRNSSNEPFIHADQAIEAARSGPVQDGSAGGGNGTASRRLRRAGLHICVFMQAHFGDHDELTINGVPMGDLDVPHPMEAHGPVLFDRGPVR